MASKKMTNKKLPSLARSLRDIERELEALRRFRPTPQTKKLQRHLAGERSSIKEQIRQAKKKATPTARARARITRQANRQRGEKMRRSWRYFKAIQQSYYPEKSLRELRSLFKKQREGLETDIPDTAWRNPSP